MKLLIISALSLLLARNSYGQILVEYYENTRSHKDQEEYYTKEVDIGDFCLHIRKHENLTYGYVVSDAGPTKGNEYFVIGPLNSFWVVTETLDLDASRPIALQSFDKLCYIFVYDLNLKPLYVIEAGYGLVGSVTYFVELPSGDQELHQSGDITILQKSVRAITGTSLSDIQAQRMENDRGQIPGGKSYVSSSSIHKAFLEKWCESTSSRNKKK